LQGIDPPELGLDHSSTFRFEVKERVKLYLYLPSAPAVMLRERFAFLFNRMCNAKRKFF
jgi:hypothetical protein